MLTPANIVLILAATAAALMAGLFYSWSCSVVPGLAKLSDANYLASMQAMNKAILNPVFFSSFFGTLLLLPISTFIHYNCGDSQTSILLLSAAIVYAVGVFGITVAGNVPLNDAIAAFNLEGASADAMAAQRNAFEAKWNMLNNIRTAAAMLCCILTIIACIAKRPS